jgi:hypothetical protein
MPRRINVTLTEPVADKLAELALIELRDTRQQAAVLLTRAVEREARRRARQSPADLAATVR